MEKETKKPAAKSRIGAKEKLERERDEFKDKWMRLYADFENFKKRSEKEKADWIRYANEKIILDFCDVLDNFERALGTNIEMTNHEAYMKGIELIFQQLNSVLKKHNAIKIEVMGKEFDPQYHEALAAVPAKEKKNTIVGVIQNGYMMGDKVVRYSKVAVSNGEKPQKKEEN